ncbi:hypothetical protein V7x_43970 [Crateriforma conspicua]|uniref:Uncharacterized protein n=1 Tax=Crateriforma conspicua TaxID=2527996 RepID=A0A5C6FN89_9PLAN|nr:hypothetical protein [Crateriforma conspicua]TWU62662.1 hypothetical protein V7x_43970 [Crateriforma conspicua]
MGNPKTSQRKEVRDEQSRSDLPDWVSDELLQKTIEIWQPYYPNQLTRDDAIAIINNVGGVIDCLRRE